MSPSTMIRALGAACIAIALLASPATGQQVRGHGGFAGHPGFAPHGGFFGHPGFAPHGQFFGHPGLFPRHEFFQPGFFPRHELFERWEFGDRRFFFFGGGVAGWPLVIAPYAAYPYPYYPYIPITPTRITRPTPSPIPIRISGIPCIRSAPGYRSLPVSSASRRASNPACASPPPRARSARARVEHAREQ